MELKQIPQTITEAHKAASAMLQAARKKASRDRLHSDAAAKKEAEALFAFPPQKVELDAQWRRSLPERRKELEKAAEERRTALIALFEKEAKK